MSSYDVVVAAGLGDTPDRHVVLPQHPEHEHEHEHEHVAVVCGFSGHGCTFVPVVGQVLADLASTGTTVHPFGLFDARRPAITGVPAQSLSPSPSSGPTLGVPA